MRPVPLGTVAGIPVRARVGAFLLPLLLTVVLATQLLPAAAPGASAVAYATAAVAAGVAFLASLLAHEASHALVARRYGVSTRSITLVFFGGVAELEREADDPRAELRIAAAGPATSLGAAVLFALAALGVGVLGAAPVVTTTLSWLAGVNLVLALFNLLPGTPLDGGRVLHAVLWRRSGDRVRATVAASGAGTAIGWGLVALGGVGFFFGNGFALWTALIGFVLVAGSRQERAAAVLRQRLGGLRVSDAMAADEAVGPDWLSVQAFVDRVVSGTRHTTFALRGFDGGCTAVVTLQQLAAVPAERRAGTRVSSVAVPARDLVTAVTDEPLATVVERLAGRMQPAVPVTDAAGALVGLLTPADLARAAEMGPLSAPVERAGTR